MASQKVHLTDEDFITLMLIREWLLSSIENQKPLSQIDLIPMAEKLIQYLAVGMELYRIIKP